MTDWSTLTHAYGSATDIPGLLGQLEPGGSYQVWSDLASRLYHQGTVYSASHAILPELTRLAREWSPADRADPILLAGSILASVDQPYGVPDPRVAYTGEIAELKALTEEVLEVPALCANPGDYVPLLQMLLAFEGVETWRDQLDGLLAEEFEVQCPGCEIENYIVFGEYGYFSTLDDMYMNNSESKRIPLRPADPASLEGVAEWLHRRMLADGHPDIADKLTYVFGGAECVDCGDGFRVDETAATRWG
jgi:hypothetical protein